MLYLKQKHTVNQKLNKTVPIKSQFLKHKNRWRNINLVS
ncbi:hypothetical protein Echvi_3405 [Echinicola vietnamensis DSM 17526]|uniref:Uncharacterized protein n=1 Tax=Echinicola vietnamensis (strain DSM 17526 / LMG 23754 / KMM 6221) TaxID=926556 RepID=L0G472_ECHVK|nr:hypothetical protein Echvi_3405 [Echinicola vietnamensis DSM 17526]